MLRDLPSGVSSGLGGGGEVGSACRAGLGGAAVVAVEGQLDEFGDECGALEAGEGPEAGGTWRWA